MPAFTGVSKLLHDSSYWKNCRISRRWNPDSLFRVLCIDDLTVPNINSYVAIITDQISRHRLIIAYLHACINLVIRCPWKTDSKMRKYWLYKSGTVCPICQTCAAPDIRIPNELACIINDRLSIWRRLCGNFGSLRLLYIFLDTIVSLCSLYFAW